jgi:hypothetical protein|tara:strand:- start:5269 stop:5652 length:384 start_codon:yes stop_codon:yes gene_type:complete
MMETIVIIIMSVSLVVNVFLLSYVRYLLGELVILMGDLSSVSENINSLVKTVISFKDHLSEVHKLERFYGDQTLENLLRHSMQLVEILDDFEEIYALTETEDDLEEEPDVEEDPIGQPAETEATPPA